MQDRAADFLTILLKLAEKQPVIFLFSLTLVLIFMSLGLSRILPLLPGLAGRFSGDETIESILLDRIRKLKEELREIKGVLHEIRERIEKANIEISEIYRLEKAAERVDREREAVRQKDHDNLSLKIEHLQQSIDRIEDMIMDIFKVVIKEEGRFK
jgi:hypothetical protein